MGGRSVGGAQSRLARDEVVTLSFAHFSSYKFYLFFFPLSYKKKKKRWFEKPPSIYLFIPFFH